MSSDIEQWKTRIKRAFDALDQVSYYQILSVSRTAKEEAIRDGYYKRAKQLHPDKVRHLPEPLKSQAMAIFKRVAEAYQTLTDPTLRRAYDEALKQGKKRLIVSDRLSIKPKGEFDFLVTDNGRKYYKAAKKDFEAGQIPHAKLNIKLCMQYEGNKKEILALLKKIEKKS